MYLFFFVFSTTLKDKSCICYLNYYKKESYFLCLLNKVYIFATTIDKSVVNILKYNTKRYVLSCVSKA